MCSKYSEISVEHVYVQIINFVWNLHRRQILNVDLIYQFSKEKKEEKT